jgi:hypothetical protein
MLEACLLAASAVSEQAHASVPRRHADVKVELTLWPKHRPTIVAGCFDA